jgi:hypothetical protein
MCQKQCFQTLRDEFRPEIQIQEIPGHFYSTISGNSEIRPGKHVFLEEYALPAAKVPSEISGKIRFISDIFFPEMYKFPTKSAKCKKTQKCKKRPENTPKFWVFYRK